MDHRKQFSTLEAENFMEGLAASIETSAAEDLLNEEVDPPGANEEKAEEVRQFLLLQIDLYKQTRLIEAIIDYQISKSPSQINRGL